MCFIKSFTFNCSLIKTSSEEKCLFFALVYSYCEGKPFHRTRFNHWQGEVVFEFSRPAFHGEIDHFYVQVSGQYVLIGSDDIVHVNFIKDILKNLGVRIISVKRNINSTRVEYFRDCVDYKPKNRDQIKEDLNRWYNDYGHELVSW